MDLRFGFDVVEKPVGEYFAYAREYGLAHLEVDLNVEHEFIETFDAKRITNLKKLSKEYAVTVSLHTPFSINPADRISMLRRANVAYLKRCVQVASDLAATHLTTHIGHCNGLPEWNWLRRQGLEQLVLSLKETLSLCKEHDVVLALENVNPMPKDSEFFYLGDNINDFEFLFSQLPSRYLKMCLDTGHAHTAEGVTTYIEKFKDKIVNVHFHDNNGKNDQHLNVGDGTIPWQQVAQAFKNAGFTGPYISECFKTTPHQAKADLQKYF
ncbi:MAG: sugar phosphate isomerase/epimerase [Candidatus Bathyarchaeota archaeon]|nr:sugar phosphate isomerase/epimerase [Candidatus Bathyarchaeota archaeon]